uniref:NADH-ubiquinone oxidoreductase chain 2 n=1 Tax=Luteuthis dentatus TaxID=167155 RepID=A0A9E9JKD2_9MOLL|nr:NADH dehydrogenase subunit 2 [Luteuthis dentatus]WAP91476.1 NADH dehydrogenase subunit 2 [Luteuthis dentatus]WAP91502.1 NADH dehydrogenase subunit 2 [Luteuthis dentatus]
MNNKFFPANFLFMNMLILGSILSLSSSHWLVMWMGLELNLMGILPLMNIKGKSFEIDSSMKYFIIQSFSSSLLMISTIILYFFSSSWYSMFNNSFISSILILSLLIKLGSVPFHLWLPNITKQMSWMMLFLILSWQKLAPLFMLSFINFNHNIILFSSILSAIFGSIQAINQTSIQLIMTYSSISHLGWMLATIMINNMIMFMYLFIYSIIILPLFYYFHSKSGYKIFNLTQYNKNMNMDFLMFIPLMMSLGGFPPFMGFMTKILILLILINMNFIIIPMILFISTLISLYFYLNLSMMMLIKSFFFLKLPSLSYNFNFIISMNIMSLFIFIPIILYAMNILNKP